MPADLLDDLADPAVPPSAKVIPIRRLPPATLDERLSKLGFGKKAHEFSQQRQHELAMLLAESGWTQQELADRLGKGQQWISRQQTFGRFLNFTPVGVRISEWRFRGLFEATDASKTESQRFTEVSLALEQTVEPQAKTSSALADKIMGRFGDAKWHPLDGMAARLDEPRDNIAATIEKLLPKAPYDAKVESKNVGLRPHYRIFRADRIVRISELLDKFGPIVEELVQQGKTNHATVSISGIATCAGMLKKYLDEWSK